jgi:hypothetical protein
MTTRITLIIAVAIVIVSVAVDLFIGSAVPGRMALFSLVATLTLILAGKNIIGRVISRPAGSRVGENGEETGNLEWAAPWERRDG